MQWHNPVGGCTTVFSVISLLSSLQHLGVQIFTSLGSRPVLVVRRKCLSQRAWLAVWVCGYTITWLSRNLQQTVKINVGPSDSNGKRKVTTRLCWRLRLKLNAFTHITLFKYHSCSVKHFVVEVKTQKKKKHPKTKKTNLTDTRILEKVRIARRYLPDGKNCSSTELLANRFLRSLRCHQNRNLDLSVYSEPRQRGTKMPLLWVETNIVKWVIKGSCHTPSPLTSLFLHVVWKSWKLKIWSLKKD